jgi:peptidoglycan/LPS O-acetylase OafA/YrhL
MRLLICASVVATHVVTNANPLQSVAPNAVVNLLHYTRQAFFFISALVLVYVSLGDLGPDGRVRTVPGQLRRRVSVLGVPYLVWSTAYMLLGLATAYSWWAVQRLPGLWFSGLLQGTDGYHMYFLLVSVEFALIFPVFLRLLQVTRRHHGWLLIGSGVLELATMALFHYVYQPEGWWRAIAGESSLTAYQFWLIAGGVAAMHFTEFHAWLVNHWRLVVFALLGTAVVATAMLFADVSDGETPEFAGRSMQPVTVPLSIAAIGAFYLVSVWIAGVDRPWSRRMVVTGTYLSFGIYLTHPAILTGLLILQKMLPGGMAYHPVPVTLAIMVLDFALSLAAAAVLARTPLSKALIGRPRRRRAAPPQLGAAPPQLDRAARPAPVPPPTATPAPVPTIEPAPVRPVDQPASAVATS